MLRQGSVSQDNPVASVLVTFQGPCHYQSHVCARHAAYMRAPHRRSLSPSLAIPGANVQGASRQACVGGGHPSPRRGLLSSSLCSEGGGWLGKGQGAGGCGLGGAGNLRGRLGKGSRFCDPFLSQFPRLGQDF